MIFSASDVIGRSPAGAPALKSDVFCLPVFCLPRSGSRLLLRRSWCGAPCGGVVLVPPCLYGGRLEQTGTEAGHLFEAEGSLLHHIQILIFQNRLHQCVAGVFGATQTDEVGGLHPDLPGVFGIGEESDEFVLLELAVFEGCGIWEISGHRDVIRIQAGAAEVVVLDPENFGTGGMHQAGQTGIVQGSHRRS